MRQKELINRASINHEALLTSLAKCDVTSLDRRIKALDFGCNELFPSDTRCPKPENKACFFQRQQVNNPEQNQNVSDSLNGHSLYTHLMYNSRILEDQNLNFEKKIGTLLIS